MSLRLQIFIGHASILQFILCVFAEGWSWHQRCYDKPPIGCFSIKPPFNNALAIPYTIEKMNVHYIHILGHDRMKLPWETALEGMRLRFRTDLKTVVIVPGWNESLKKIWIENIIGELIKKEPMNIIVVDWQGGALVFRYIQAISNARVVGAMVAYFLKELTTLGVTPDSFHLIGNSLGCHLCGHIGARFPGLKRISAMDPSGRAYDGTPPEVRLDPTDAEIVDVLHTDGTKIIGFGSKSIMGTMDFYANGGENQPGCAKSVFGILWDMIIGGIGVNKCSHTRATTIFINSINRCKFPSHQCCNLEEAYNVSCEKCTYLKKTIDFGYNMNEKLKGIFSFKTGKKPVC